MRQKITYLFAALLFPIVTNAQTKTITFQEIVTGKGVFFGAVMDQGNSTITMTIAGPDDRWFGVGFGNGMSNADVLMYTDGKSGATHTLEQTDYKLASQAIGGVNKDAQQDWTIVSNTVNTGVRTIVATRALDTGDANDIALSFSSTSVNVIWAKHSTASHTLNYHGSTNRGVKQFTWTDNSASIDEVVSHFELTQSKGLLNIKNISGGNYSYKLISTAGNVINEINDLSGDQSLSTENIAPGAYIVLLTSEFGVLSKVVRL